MEKNSLGKYSLGVGDRFAHQAEAQLQACLLAQKQGVEIIPVWNKSNREHNIIGSEPASVRAAADSAVRNLGWTRAYHVDADHINFETVDRFLDASDFFTIDVADWIGKPASAAQIEAFATRHPEFDRSFVAATAAKYLAAITEAGRIYRKIEAAKGKNNFIPEVSMDETDSPQTPAELLIILVAIADEKIPIQTIAPKFTGRFNKGVDYQGNVEKFTKEFSVDIATIAQAVEKYDLPRNLKLSVHSGSDKFSLYPIIRRTLPKFGAGLHIKTAGTTWLEELIGLAEAGGDALEKCLDALRPGGRAAYPNGVEPAPKPRVGITVTPYDALFGDEKVQFTELNKAVEVGHIEVPIAATFELADAAAAHRRVEAGRVPGKVLLKMR